MKTAETKSASHQPNNTAAKSFFNQGQEQTFFSENSSDRTSFFPSTASDQVQFKPIAGGRSFFSPASVALQAKCAACEAEEQAAAKESMAEPPTLQRTPAFESEGAIQAKVAPKTDAIALPTPSQTPPNSDTKELEQPEEAIAGTPEIQMMPAFSSAEDTGDGEDGNAEQPPVQFSLKVGQPGDAYEREADAMADRVVSMPRVMSSDVTPKTIGAPQPQQVNRKQTMGMRSLMQQPADGSPAPAPKNLESRLQSQGSGAPLDTNTRSEMEGAFDADFSGVQVHTGQEAATLNQSLGARAFTHGNKIFFNSGEYQPQSQSGKHLLAHELTHTLQQGASVQRKPAVSPTSHEVQMLPSIISSELAKYARDIPGYTLLTVIIGFNPLTGNRVVRNATALLEGLMGLVPFGTFIFDKLREHGILQSAFKWVEGELTRLDLSLARIERTVEEAWEDVTLAKGFNYNLEVLKRHFGKLYNDVKSFALSLVNHVIELIKKAVISQVEKLLADNKAWALIKKILHYDPLKGEAVEATIEEILEDFLRLIGKEQELEQMREKGTLKETAAWIKTQIGTFLSLLGELKGLFTAAWDAIQPQNLPNLATNVRNLVTQATGFLKRVWTFAVTVAVKVLELIKKVLLGWLSQHAAKTPGYFLLTVVLGKDIFSQQVVPRSVTNIIKGFITLLPNGEQQYKQMEETGVIARAAGRIEALMSQLGITWAFVRDLFLGIWNKLTIESLIQPIATFIQIVSLFKEPILRLLKFTIEVIKIVLDLVLQLMNFPPGIVGRIINNAMQAFEDIKKNPVGFLLNLLKAVKTGFLKFFDNILKHLLSGVKDWLFSQLGKAGIEVPKDFTLESVLKLVFKVLDITMEKMWKKLADRIGQPAVDKIRGAIDKLVGIWNFVKDVQQRGMAAIWEYIQGQISNLWDTVLGFVRDWIMKKIVDKVVTKLLSMLDPTGIMAVVNSFIAFFNAVQSAIEYFRQILEIIDSFVGTVAEIATGSVDRAAQFLENLLARSLPVAIGFLANQVGLGNVGEKIQEIIADVRLMVDKALDWLVDKAVTLGKAALNALGLGGGDDKKKDGKYDGQIGKEIPFSVAQESHRLWVAQSGTDAVVMMASEEKPVSEHLNDYEKMAQELQDKEKQTKVTTLISQARGILTGLDTNADKLAGDAAKPEAKPEEVAAEDDAVESGEDQLVSTIKQIREELGLKNDVKASIAKELKGKTIKDFAQEEALLNSIYGKYTPEGLKSLKFVKRPKEIGVLVSASLEEEVAKLDLSQPENWERLFEIMQRVKYLAKGSTWIYAYYNGDKIAEVKNQPGAHAEAVFINKYLTELRQRMVNEVNNGILKKDGSVNIHWDMSRTPCGGCSESHVDYMLSELKKDPLLTNIKINLTIKASAVEGSTGIEGLKKLLDPERLDKIEIEATNIWDVISDKMASNAAYYETDTGIADYVSLNFGDFRSKALKLKETIDKVVAEHKNRPKDMSK